MKKLLSIAAARFIVLAFLVLFPAASFAAFVSGSTGADGAFTPTKIIVKPLPASRGSSFITLSGTIT